MYRYFISYFFNTKSGGINVGNTVILNERAIVDHKDIEEISKRFEKDFEIKNVVIINFIPLPPLP